MIRACLAALAKVGRRNTLRRSGKRTPAAVGFCDPLDATVRKHTIEIERLKQARKPRH
jgi:hypothetical protein